MTWRIVAGVDCRRDWATVVKMRPMLGDMAFVEAGRVVEEMLYGDVQRARVCGLVVAKEGVDPGCQVKPACGDEVVYCGICEGLGYTREHEHI